VTPFLANVRLFVIALDANGNEIVNPTVYDQPISLGLLTDNTGLMQLNAAYASISQASAGATSASVTANGGIVQLWSPLDQATLTLAPNVSAFQTAVIVAGIGTLSLSSPSPIPSSLPSSLPSPLPTTSPAPFLYVGADNRLGMRLSYSYYQSSSSATITAATNTLQFYNTCGGNTGYPCFASVSVDVFEPDYFNGFTIDTTTDPRCAGTGNGPIVVITPYYSDNSGFYISPETTGTAQNPARCTVYVRDDHGGAIPINTSVTTTSVIGQ
jgi:hypothetical protein